MSEYTWCPKLPVFTLISKHFHKISSDEIFYTGDEVICNNGRWELCDTLQIFFLYQRGIKKFGKIGLNFDLVFKVL